MSYMLLGVLWLGLPVIAFWPGPPPDLALVWLVVAIAGSFIVVVLSTLFSVVRWISRRTPSRSTVDEE
jgi:hypothetical protein